MAGKVGTKGDNYYSGTEAVDRTDEDKNLWLVFSSFDSSVPQPIRVIS